MDKVYFDPFEKQKELENAVYSYEYSFILYGGAIRGGKTYGMLGIFIGLGVVFPNSRWVIIREDLPMIKRSVLPVFYKVCPPNLIKTKPSQHNEWTCTFTNGSEIMFLSENFDRDKDLERFKGLECDGFGAEEISGLQLATFYKMFERSGTWRMDERLKDKKEGKLIPPKVILATCNPTQNWVKEHIYDKWKADKLPKGWKYINSRVYDNPHIDEEWIEGLRISMPPITFDRFVEGDWEAIENPNQWAYYFDYIKHVFMGSISYIPHYPITLSFDFNNVPTTCIASQLSDDFAHIIDEVGVDKGGTEELCNRIKSMFPHNDFIVTGDASGRNNSTQSNRNNYEIIKDVLEINDYNLRVRKANIGLKDSRTLINAFLLRFPELQISVNCKNLIKQLRLAEPDNKGGLLKDRVDHKNDYLDCFRYLIDSKYPDYLTNAKKYTEN